jgi:integrase
MSPKKRSRENKALPRGWRYRYGAYYYRVPKGAEPHWDGKREFRLGGTLSEAHAEFARRVGYEDTVVTMDQLCDRYALEVVPNKKPATQRSNQYSIARIRRAFSGNRVASIRPMDIYKYRDHMGKEESQKKANLDLEVLSHMFTKSIQWGVRNTHPMTNKLVTKFSLDHRRVLPLQDELIAFAAGLPRKWQLYISLKLWTGRRQGELLALTKRDITEQGMRFRNNKPPYNEFILEWEPETEAVVKELLALPGAVRGIHLFHTRDGQPYLKEDGTASGFQSMWQRWMVKAVKEGRVTRKFTEHDLRKVRASSLSTSQAQELLQHTNAKMTGRYQLGDKVVSMARGKS